MPKKRLLAFMATAGVAIAAAAAAILPTAGADAAVACAPAYADSTVYTGGMQASYNGHNWTAKWWTQHEAPSTGGSGVWTDGGSCGGSGGGGGTGSCSYPNWVAGQWYATGAIVRYTNGLYYQATHDNPGYDPTISTWFWSPYACGGGGGGDTGGGSTSGFVVSEAQFNQMFPSRNSFYTYAGLTDAMKKYPAFAT
ncbi:carbohydrate-binding protein, partial [Dactylosporangium darangshiense]